jgi:chitinase
MFFLPLTPFAGIDIDWEYPGAGDRGGAPEDIPNFVLMLKTLRETFKAAGREYGITLTIPSSFWYLRWFDLPGLLKYADCKSPYQSLIVKILTYIRAQL